MAEEISLIKRYYNGIEDVSNSVHGAHLKGVQLGNSSNMGQFIFALSPTMSYTYGNLDATLRTFGQVEKNRVMMAVMLNEDGDIFSFIVGRNILDGEIFVFPPGGDFDNRSIGAINYATLSVDHNLLHDIAGPDIYINGQNWLEKRHVFRASAWHRKMMCTRITHLTSLLARSRSSLSPLQIVQFQRQMLEVLMQGVVMDEQNNIQHSRLSEATIVRRAEEWIDSQEPETILLSELCKALNVSRRSLQRAYTNTLGMGPAHYLLLKRLSAVRLTLKLSNPGITRVTDVAMRFGFWELGRFAIQYKRLFGERPSDTLNKQQRP